MSLGAGGGPRRPRFGWRRDRGRLGVRGLARPLGGLGVLVRGAGAGSRGGVPGAGFFGGGPGLGVLGRGSGVGDLVRGSAGAFRPSEERASSAASTRSAKMSRRRVREWSVPASCV